MRQKRGVFEICELLGLIAGQALEDIKAQNTLYHIAERAKQCEAAVVNDCSDVGRQSGVAAHGFRQHHTIIIP